jgi:hypothetical protein
MCACKRASNNSWTRLCGEIGGGCLAELPLPVESPLTKIFTGGGGGVLYTCNWRDESLTGKRTASTSFPKIIQRRNLRKKIMSCMNGTKSSDDILSQIPYHHISKIENVKKNVATTYLERASNATELTHTRTRTPSHPTPRDP